MVDTVAVSGGATVLLVVEVGLLVVDFFVKSMNLASCVPGIYARNLVSCIPGMYSRNFCTGFFTDFRVLETGLFCSVVDSGITVVPCGELPVFISFS